MNTESIIGNFSLNLFVLHFCCCCSFRVLCLTTFRLQVNWQSWDSDQWSYRQIYFCICCFFFSFPFVHTDIILFAISQKWIGSARFGMRQTIIIVINCIAFDLVYELKKIAKLLRKTRVTKIKTNDETCRTKWKIQEKNI